MTTGSNAKQTSDYHRCQMAAPRAEVDAKVPIMASAEVPGSAERIFHHWQRRLSRISCCNWHRSLLMQWIRTVGVSGSVVILAQFGNCIRARVDTWGT